MGENKAYYRSLVDKLIKASNIISSSSTRSSGNYVTVTQAISDAFITYRKNHRKEKIRRLFYE